MRKKINGVQCVYYTVLTLLALVIILPFIWLISTSFDHFESYSLPFPPRLLPESPSLFNYQMALQNVPVLKYLLNTSVIVALDATLNVLLATLAGFCLSKGRFPGKGVVLMFLLSSMMIPFEIKLMPIYQTIGALGLTNSFIGVVLPGVMTNAVHIFFVKQFCDSIPNDLYESSMIDGAGKLRTYAQIFLPLMGPVSATVVVLCVINTWNDLLWPMIVLTDNAMSTLQLGLVRYNSTIDGVVHVGISTALSMMSIIPLAIVFSFMQKYIVQSIASTGIKQ